MSSFSWSLISPDWLASSAFAHHGVGVLDDGTVLGWDVERQALVLLAPAGGIERVAVPVVEAHGMCVRGSTVWVADCGFCNERQSDGSYLPVAPAEVKLRRGGQVLAWDLSGRVLQVLPAPTHEAYERASFLPTGVDVAPDGSVWVADGYGAGLVHQFAPDGRLLRTLSGQEGAGRFDCPHDVLVDPRGFVVIADREANRLQVYDLEGRFVRILGEGVLRRPAGLCLFGDLLAVAELEARITLLELDGTVVAHLGDDPSAAAEEGWPNVLDSAGQPQPPPLRAGRFCSPHAVAAAPDGSLVVAEWLLGGRLTRLTPSREADLAQ